jgi:hypothetical protein
LLSSLVTEVEINFIAEAAQRTVVKFEHKNLYRLGEGEKAVDRMDEGWGMILERYAKVAKENR